MGYALLHIPSVTPAGYSHLAIEMGKDITCILPPPLAFPQNDAVACIGVKKKLIILWTSLIFY
jgi:hypothetical protein